MVIVSQMKNEFINFDNSTNIYIVDSETKGYKISVDFAGGGYTRLGIYETKARATEVLQEIINKYMDYSKIVNVTGTDIRQVCVLPKTYIMPES